MTQGSERKQRKKYRIPFFAALFIVFLIVVLVMYSVTSESMVTYYYQTEDDIELISVTPENIDGVSQDVTIVLEWNHLLTPELADAVRIRPSARGEWFVSGNYLMFTPRQLAAGTYYSVTIPKGTILTEDGDELQETVFFSFETEDPDLRIPDTVAFDVDGRGFRFSENEDVAIPVNHVGDDSGVDVTVYRADSSEDFIDAFAELFAYPSWASLSIARYEADDRGFDKISDSVMSVRNQNGLSYIDLGSLSEGQYLVRIESGKDRFDVPVTVSAVTAGVLCENNALALWSHVDGKPYAGAEVLFGEETYTLDENGFVSIPCTLTKNGIRREPEALALTICGDDGEIVHFLTADDISLRYDCDLFVNTVNLADNGTLLASGSLFTENGLAVNGVGVLRLVSSVETVFEKRVKVEDGFFSAEWEDLELADGRYSLVFCFDHKDILTEQIRVGSLSNELILTVEKNDDTVRSGESVRYVARVTDKAGKPVTDAVVSMNGENGVAVDKNGEATFRKAYQVPDGIASVQNNANFHVFSTVGDADDVTVSVSVISNSRNRMQSSEPEVVSVQKETLPLIAEDRSFGLAVDEMIPALHMTYYHEDYGIEIPAEDVNVTVPESIDTAMGETISIAADVEGSRRITAVSLCKGRIPDALCGKTLTNEGFRDHSYGTLEEQRVFFGSEEINAAFSAVNRSGDYYIRVAVKSVNGKVYVNYVPVRVDGVTITCPEGQSFSAGYMVVLPFRVNEEGSFDYVLTVGDAVYEGTAEDEFSVFSGISTTGQYHGNMTLYYEESVVATKDFDFEVYYKTPMFTEVVEGVSDNVVYTCQVKNDTKDIFSKAYDIMELPGDQILQRMGRTLFYHTYGDVINGDLSYLNYDLSSLQNSDGSFGRYDGAAGDILLSVFVAEQDEFICDRASLCAYLKYRLHTADSPETAALACWGLSYFDIDCSESMAMIQNDGGKSDRLLLYLAEGYEAAGNRVEAEKIYLQLKKELIEDGDMLHLPDSDDQYNIANTAFMLDLSLKLNQNESEGLLEFLVHSDIQIQSGRYLLMASIVRMVDTFDISPIGAKGVKQGFTQISVIEKDLEDVPVLTTSFLQNGENVSSISTGQTAEIVVQWEAAENSIYLVYAADMGGISIVEKDGLVYKKGYAEYVTSSGTAAVTFKASASGEHLAPKVYIVDLTTGRIVGRSNESGWKVTK